MRTVKALRMLLPNSSPFNPRVSILAVWLMGFQTEKTFVCSYLQGLRRFQYSNLCEKCLIANCENLVLILTEDPRMIGR